MRRRVEEREEVGRRERLVRRRRRRRLGVGCACRADEVEEPRLARGQDAAEEGAVPVPLPQRVGGDEEDHGEDDEADRDLHKLAEAVANVVNPGRVEVVAELDRLPRRDGEELDVDARVGQGAVDLRPDSLDRRRDERVEARAELVEGRNRRVEVGEGVDERVGERDVLEGRELGDVDGRHVDVDSVRQEESVSELVLVADRPPESERCERERCERERRRTLECRR